MKMRYFKLKIENYKIQDRKAKGEINKNKYINEQWCLTQFKNRCQKCNSPFNFEAKQGELCSNFTAQRLCNDTAHEMENCVAYCF